MQTRTIDLIWEPTRTEDLVEWIYKCGVRTTMMLERQTPEVRDSHTHGNYAERRSVKAKWHPARPIPRFDRVGEAALTTILAAETEPR